MVNITLDGNEVIVEWEGKDLNVWILDHDTGSRIRLSEHNVETIRKVIQTVREQKWLDYQTNKQQSAQENGT